MNKNITKIDKQFKLSAIIYCLLFTILILPNGKVLLQQDSFWAFSISNILSWLLIIFAIPMVIVKLILSFKARHFRDFKKLYFIILIMNFLLLLSNNNPNLSAMGELGYIHMVLPDVIIRILGLVVSYSLLYHWVSMNYPENKEAGRTIVKIFAVIQIVLFAIAGFGSYYSLAL